MTIEEAVKERRSIRRYLDTPLKEEDKKALENEIERINRESGLCMQLVTEDTETFKGFLAHYGNFRNVRNYIALIGREDPLLEERCGYYGEQLVLSAETMGLSTCWVGLTFKKKKAKNLVKDGERLVLVIAVGYKAEEKKAHKSRKIEEVMEEKVSAPSWFIPAVECALLAPTALNQQKFKFIYEGENRVKAVTVAAPFSKVDLGIAKYHFKIGAKGAEFTFI